MADELVAGVAGALAERVRDLRDRAQRQLAEVYEAASTALHHDDGTVDREAVKQAALLPESKAPLVLRLAARAEEKRLEEAGGRGPQITIYGGLHVPERRPRQPDCDVVCIDVDDE